MHLFQLIINVKYVKFEMILRHRQKRIVNKVAQRYKAPNSQFCNKKHD